VDESGKKEESYSPSKSLHRRKKSQSHQMTYKDIPHSHEDFEGHEIDASLDAPLIDR